MVCAVELLKTGRKGFPGVFQKGTNFRGKEKKGICLEREGNTVEQGIAVEYAVCGVNFERAVVHDPSAEAALAEAALHFRRATNLHRHAHKRQAGKE